MTSPGLLIERWRDAAVARMPLIADEWWDPVCDQVVTAVLGQEAREVASAVESLAATRCSQRWTVAEGLEDLSALSSVLIADSGALFDTLEIACRYSASWMTEADQDWARREVDPLTQHPTPTYLILRLREHLETMEHRPGNGEVDPWEVLVARLVESGDVAARLAGRVKGGRVLRRAFAGRPRAMDEALILAVAPTAEVRRGASELMRAVEVHIELHDLPRTAWGVEQLLQRAIGSGQRGSPLD